MEREARSRNEPAREGLEEYAKSLDLTPVEVLALLDNALAQEPTE